MIFLVCVSVCVFVSKNGKRMLTVFITTPGILSPAHTRTLNTILAKGHMGTHN